MYGSKDPTRPGQRLEATKTFNPQIEIIRLEGKSHWLMVDSKDEIAKAVINMIKTRVQGNTAGKANL